MGTQVKTDEIQAKMKLICIERLVPFDRNPRLHSEYQVEQIANSIREFGFLVPILADEEMNVIAGHGRLMAANVLGRKKVPVVMASHLTEAQKRAYVIADNRIAQNSEWDEGLLKELAVELDGEGVDLELVGFTMPEIEDFTVGEKKSAKKTSKGISEQVELVSCPKCSHRFELLD
jgi:ParB-like chromosome segregation protein Spo0J